MKLGRLLAPLADIIESVVAHHDYFALYQAKVVGQSPDLAKLEVVPSDPRLPSMASVPLRHGVPGARGAVRPGTSVLVGWENGDPSLPFCALWSGDASVATLTLVADTVNVGGDAGAEPPPKGTTYRAAEDAYFAAVNAAIAAIGSALTTLGDSSAATAVAAVVTAAGKFNGAASTYLATNARVK